MRAALLLTALLAAPAMADDGIQSISDAMIKASLGNFVPLQMADGSQTWRWVGKQIKDDTAELRYADLIAQGMGKALWCPRGWEEIKRTPQSGMLIIEGRCR